MTMRSLVFKIAIGLCFAPNCFAQLYSPELATDTDILHSIRRSTVSIGLHAKEGEVTHFVTVGSAVIVSLDGGHNCLLSAKHVFSNPEIGYTPTQVFVRLPKDEPQAKEDLGLPLTLYGPRGDPLWMGAADGADLAVSPMPNTLGAKDVHSIPITDFGDADDLFQGSTVVVLGYAELLGPDYQTTPIARNGIVAWTNPEGPLDHTFLVDANVFSGNSGGPVFHLPTGMNRKGQIGGGGRIHLIGIVSKDAYEEAPIHAGSSPATSLDQATGKMIPFTAKVLNIGGIGIIEPVSKAKKLVMDFLAPHTPHI